MKNYNGLWRDFLIKESHEDDLVDLWELECLLKFNKSRPSTNIYTDMRGLDGVVIVKTASQAVNLPSSEKKIVRLHIKFTPHEHSVKRVYIPWLIKKVLDIDGIEGMKVQENTIKYIGRQVSAYTE